MTTSLAPHPLLIPPALAKEIGLHEAVILQQIHYWLEKSNHLIDGCRWIYNTYQAWQQQFPFLSIGAIRRAIARLEGLNLLKTERFEQRRWNQTKWYSINYQRLEVLISSICSNQDFRSARFEQLDLANLSSSSTETTALTTSENTSPLTPQSQEIEREIKQSSGNTVIPEFCTSSLEEDELVSNEQADSDEDLSSAPAENPQNDLQQKSCSDIPAGKLNSRADQFKPEKQTNCLPQPFSANQSSEQQSDRFISPTKQPVFELPARTQLLTRLSVLTTDSLDNLRLNTSLASALDRYPERVNDALEYFQQAIATWKNKPGIGLFIHAVRTGQKPSFTKPGCGWKEWADEATKRRLMQYSESHNGDIMVYFLNGGQELWSQLRYLSWSEVERVASAGETVSAVANYQNLDR